MKARTVYICCCLLSLAAAPLQAQYPPPGLVQWGSEAYTLDAGESMPFRVDWDQIPVRRWMLLVEGDLRISHLNLRRVGDGSLVYDLRDESRHLVEIPWGTGESLSGVLSVNAGGEYAISIWGPPQDDYLRAYSYDVNRALEALTDDDRSRAQAHLLSALREDPDDVVAQTLLRGLTGGRTGTDIPAKVAPAEADSTTAARLAGVRARAEELRQAGQYYAALDTLHQIVSTDLGVEGLAQVYGDLTALYLDLGNPVQAQVALDAAVSLGLSQDEAAELQHRLEASR